MTTEQATPTREQRSAFIQAMFVFFTLARGLAPLLRFTVRRMKKDVTDRHNELRAYYWKRASGPDYGALLLADLRSVGVVTPHFDFAAAAILGLQNQIAEHEHPAGVLGFLNLLEEVQVWKQRIPEFEQMHGCKLDGLKQFAEGCQGRRQELDALIGKFGDHRLLIYRNHGYCSGLLDARIEQINKQVENRS